MTDAYHQITEGIGEQHVHYVRGNRLPSLVAQIVDEFGVPLDLTDRKVRLSLRRTAGIVENTADWVTERDVLVQDAASGSIYYDVQPGDMDTNPGEFELVIKVYDASDNLLLTVPTERDVFVIIRDDPFTGLS